MALRRMRLALPGAALLALSSAAVEAQTVGRPCSLTWEETTHGGDVLVTRAEFQLGPAMRQQDGSYMIMGQGQASVTYQPGGGCTATAGSPFTARYLAVLSSSPDGVDVDISSTDASSDWVTVRCGPHVSQNRAGLSAPPTVTLEERDGASHNYTYAAGFGMHRGGASGRVVMHYCSGP